MGGIPAAVLLLVGLGSAPRDPEPVVCRGESLLSDSCMPAYEKVVESLARRMKHGDARGLHGTMADTAQPIELRMLAACYLVRIGDEAGFELLERLPTSDPGMNFGLRSAALDELEGLRRKAPAKVLPRVDALIAALEEAVRPGEAARRRLMDTLDARPSTPALPQPPTAPEAASPPLAGRELFGDLEAPRALTVEGNHACWTVKSPTDTTGIDCAVLPAGKPRTVWTGTAKNYWAHQVDLVLRGGTLTWLESNASPEKGAILRARPFERGAASAVRTLAEGLGNPRRLAVADRDVFWLDDVGQGNDNHPGVWHVRAGSRAEPLALLDLPADFEPWSLAVSGDRLYIGGRGGLVAVPFAGGPVSWILHGAFVQYLSVAGDWAAWSSNGEIWAVKVSDGAPALPVRLAEAQANPEAPLVVGDRVYWQEAYKHLIRVAPAAGGPFETVATDQWVRALAAAGDNLYWTSTESPEPGALRTIALGPGTAAAPTATGPKAFCPSGAPPCATIFDSGHEVSAIAAGGGFVFWRDRSSATLWRAPVSGAEVPRLLYANIPESELAVVAGKLYWTDRTLGQIESASFDGSGVATAAAGEDAPTAIRVGPAGTVLWRAASGVRQLDPAVPRVTQLAGSDAGGCFVLDGNWLFATESSGLAHVGDQVYSVIRRQRPGTAREVQSVVGWRSHSQLRVLVETYAPGGKPLVLADSRERPTGFAVAGDRVYWVDQSGGTLRIADLATGKLSSVGGAGGGSDREPAAPVVTTGRVFWSSSAGIFSTALDGSDLQTVFPAWARALVVADGGLVYLDAHGSVGRVSLGR